MVDKSTNIKSESSNKKIKLNFSDSKYATGRRKKSIAKVCASNNCYSTT